MLIKNLMLQDVISVGVKGTFRECLDKIRELKIYLLSQGLYSTSPVIYRILEEKMKNMKMELIIQLNREVDSIETEMYTYKKEIKYKQCFYIRYLAGEYTSEQIQKLLRDKAEKENVQIESPYYIVLPLPDGKVLDVYAPIKGERP